MADPIVKKSNQLVQGTLAADTPIVIGGPNGTYVFTTPAQLEAYFKIRQTITNTASVPFTHTVTHIATHTMAGARTISPNTSGAKPGHGALQRIIANGATPPVFSGFKRSNASKEWVNTAGVVNVVIFLFDGTSYWYTIYQEAGGSTVVTPVQLTAPVLIATASGQTSIGLSWDDVAGESSYELQVSTDGGANWAALATPAADAISYNHGSLAASTTRHYRNRAVGDGVNTQTSPWSNVASATTQAASGGDTSPPTVVSRQTTSATSIGIAFTEECDFNNTAGWSFKKNDANLPFSGIQVGGPVFTFQVAGLAAGDELTVSYNAGVGSTRDLAGNPLASFTDEIVINNLTGGGNNLTVGGSALTVSGQNLTVTP